MKRLPVTLLRVFLFLTLTTGVLFPSVVTFMGDFLFPRASGGSLLTHGGRTVGSSLIAQEFTLQKNFWPRPSAVRYLPTPSNGSNLGPTDRGLRDSIDARRRRFVVLNHLPSSAVVPEEMCTASGSGIDPHIGPEAARLQVERVAQARGLNHDERKQLEALVERCVEPPQWGILGDERVNVLLLNVAVDSIFSKLEPDSSRKSRN